MVGYLNNHLERMNKHIILIFLGLFVFTNCQERKQTSSVESISKLRNTIEKLRGEKEELRTKVHGVTLSDFNSYLKRDSLMDEWTTTMNKLKNLFIDSYGKIPTDTLIHYISQEYNGYIFPEILNKITPQEKQNSLIEDALKVYEKYNKLTAKYLGLQLCTDSTKHLILKNRQEEEHNVCNALKAIPNKYYLIHFWGTWSGTCRDFDDLYKDNYDQWKEKGLEIIGVNVDADWNKFKAYLNRRNTPWKQYFDIDRKLADAINNQGVPLFAIVDDKSKMVHIIKNDDINTILSQAYEIMGTK